MHIVCDSVHTRLERFSMDTIINGFKYLNPDIVKPDLDQADIYPPPYKLDMEGLTKIRLAEKLMSGEKLTETEKRQIYRYLTGIDAPRGSKRGARAKTYRDLGLAIDYLFARDAGQKKAGEVKRELAKIYELPGEKSGDIVIVNDDTFYKALHNGLSMLESSAREWIKSVESGEHEYMNPEKLEKSTATAKLHIELIDKYKKRQPTEEL